MNVKINREEFTKLSISDMILLITYLMGDLKECHDEGRELLVEELREALNERIDEQLLIQ